MLFVIFGYANNRYYFPVIQIVGNFASVKKFFL